MADDDSNCQRAVLGLITMDENRVPHLFRTIPSDALTVLDTKHIHFIFHEYPQPSPCHFSLPFWMRTRTSNLVFQQTVNRASGLELLEPPFQNDLPHIAEFSFLPRSKNLKFGPQRLPNPQANLCFP